MAKFTTTKETDSVMHDLQLAFGVADNAQVIRKALALARVAARHANPCGVLTIVGADGPVEVLMKT